MASKIKVSVCFVAPVDSTEKTAVKTAYRDVGQQIIKFAEALKLDPNIIIAHSVVSDDVNDLKACAYNIANPANVKIAELQTINTKVAKKLSSVDKPQQPDTEVPGMKDELDENDPPRIKAVDWKPAFTKVEKAATSDTSPAQLPAPAVSSAVSDEVLTKAVLANFDRLTEKTRTLVTFFVKNKDKKVTKAEIVKGSGLADPDVTSWLAVPSKNIKALTNPERGFYLLDSAKALAK
jgi:hypothetical protein